MERMLTTEIRECGSVGVAFDAFQEVDSRSLLLGIGFWGFFSLFLPLDAFFVFSGLFVYVAAGGTYSTVWTLRKKLLNANLNRVVLRDVRTLLGLHYHRFF